MARKIRASQLPDAVRALPEDRRAKILEEEGFQLMTPDEEKADMLGTNKGFWDMMAMGQQREADAQSPEVMKEAGRGMARAGAGTLSAAAGGAPLPIAFGMGVINSMGGPDPWTPQGMAGMLVNAATGGAGNIANWLAKSKALKGLGAPSANAAANALTQGGLAAGGQAVGGGGMPSMLGAGALGATAGAISPAMAAFLSSVRQAPSSVRPKVVNILDELRKRAASSGSQTQAGAALPEAPGIPPPQAASGAAPAAFDQRLNSMLERARAMSPDAPVAAEGDDLAALLQKSIDRNNAQKAGQQLPPAQPQVPVEPPLLQAPQPAATAASVAANAAPEDDIFAAMNAALAKRKPGIDTDAERVVNTILSAPGSPGKGVQGYVDELLDTPQGMAQLGKDYKALQAAFPDGEARDAIRTRILQKVAEGVGTQGAFGDLSLIGRLKSFGGRDFDGRKGADIINEVFGPDGTTNLNAMHDALESSMQQAAEGSKRGWRFYVNGRNVVLGIPFAGATVFAGSGGGMGVGALAAGAMAADAVGGAAMRRISIPLSRFAEMVASNRTKSADVIKSMVEGTSRYSTATVNQVVAGLRRRAEEDAEVPAEKLEQEIQQELERMRQMGKPDAEIAEWERARREGR